MIFRSRKLDTTIRALRPVRQREAALQLHGRSDPLAMERIPRDDVDARKAEVVRNSPILGCEIGELIEFNSVVRGLFAKLTALSSHRSAPP